MLYNAEKRIKNYYGGRATNYDLVEDWDVHYIYFRTPFEGNINETTAGAACPALVLHDQQLY